MTVCAAFRDGKRIYIGADSGVCDEQLILSGSDNKIVKSKHFCAAIAGSPRMRDMLEIYDAPKPPWQNIRRYLIAKWIPGFETLLKGHGLESEGLDSEIILVIRSRIFLLDPIMSATEPPIAVIGSGGAIALGALRVLQKIKPPRERLRAALLESCAADLHCRTPIKIIEIAKAYSS